MAVLAHRRNVELVGGVMAVLARCHNFESASGLSAEPAHRRNVKLVVELTALLACCLLA
jgi:hypothetical protein